MNKEVKKLWIDALRSGEYDQGQYRLRVGDCFCCLGVLTDVYIKETGDGAWTRRPGESEDSFIFKGDSVDTSSLPIEVVKWAELCQGDPYVDTNTSCISLNDRLGYDFNQIADVIEEKL